MKKLITLSDFVLEQRMTSEEIAKVSFSQIHDHIFAYYDKVFAYTKFLKQPLALGMFVPCDEEGNVLKKYSGVSFDWHNVPQAIESDEYLKAKEKVLFEGWTHEDRYGWVQHHELGLEINTETGTLAIFHENGIGYGYVKKVEDLVSYALTLTPSALEAIGIKQE